MVTDVAVFAILNRLSHFQHVELPVLAKLGLPLAETVHWKSAARGGSSVKRTQIANLELFSLVLRVCFGVFPVAWRYLLI